MADTLTVYTQIARNKRRTVILLVVVVLVFGLFGWVLGETSDLGPGLLPVFGVIALATSVFSYYTGDKVALWTAGAKLVDVASQPYVVRMVENLAITAGLPAPKVYMINDPVPNAFATGRDPEHASIAVTTGIVQLLENEELEAVLAHEISHIKNYDVRLMTVVVVAVGAIALMANFFWRARLLGGGRRNNNLGIVFLVFGLALVIITPLVAELIKLAISRKREYLADASGALLTRFPEGLARALEKISRVEQPVARASQATAHLYIVNPFGARRSWLKGVFSTHPPIEERIKLLRQMAS